MDIECCTKNVALKTENETQNREQWRHVFSDNIQNGNRLECHDHRHLSHLFTRIFHDLE